MLYLIDCFFFQFLKKTIVAQNRNTNSQNKENSEVDFGHLELNNTLCAIFVCHKNMREYYISTIHMSNIAIVVISADITFNMEEWQKEIKICHCLGNLTFFCSFYKVFIKLSIKQSKQTKGINHFIVTVNKMDLCLFNKETFDKIKQNMQKIFENLNIKSQNIQYVAMCALNNININVKNMLNNQSIQWWDNQPSLIECLKLYSFDLAKSNVSTNSETQVLRLLFETPNNS